MASNRVYVLSRIGGRTVSACTEAGQAVPAAPLVAFRTDTGGLAWAAPPVSAVEMNLIPGSAYDLALDGNTLFVG